MGTACKPESLQESNGSFFRGNSLAPLTDEEIEKHKEIQDSYDQMQAAVHKVIYRNVDNTTFLQVKNEPNSDAAMWKKVILIHADMDSLYAVLYTPPPNPSGLRSDSLGHSDCPRTPLGLHLDSTQTSSKQHSNQFHLHF